MRKVIFGFLAFVLIAVLSLGCTGSNSSTTATASPSVTAAPQAQKFIKPPFYSEFKAPFVTTVSIRGKNHKIRYGIDYNFSGDPDAQIWFYTYDAEKTAIYRWIIVNKDTGRVLVVISENDYSIRFTTAENEVWYMKSDHSVVFSALNPDLSLGLNFDFKDAAEIVPQLKQAFRCEVGFC